MEEPSAAPETAVEQTPTETDDTTDQDASKEEAGHGEESKIASSQPQINLEESGELTPPPLPPRPGQLDLLSERDAGSGSLRVRSKPSRPQLISKPTTALSVTDVHIQNHWDASRPPSSPTSRAVSRRQSLATIGRFASHNGSDADDAGSVYSKAPTLGPGEDVESLLGVVNSETPAWKALSAQLEMENPFEKVLDENDILNIKMQHEFDELAEINAEGTNEGNWTLWTAFGYGLTLCTRRAGVDVVEGKTKTFHDSFVSWETYMESSWR